MDEVFRGKPLNQVHPALVHFPVGLWVLSLLFDLATLFFGANNPLVRGRSTRWSAGPLWPSWLLYQAC